MATSIEGSGVEGIGVQDPPVTPFPPVGPGIVGGGGAPPPGDLPEFISIGAVQTWSIFSGAKMVQVPPDFEAGDLLLMWVGNTELDNVVTPTGFTLICSQPPTGARKVTLFGRIADGSETAFSYDPDGFSQGAACILAFRHMGADVADLDPQIERDAGPVPGLDSFIALGITPAVDNTLVITSVAKYRASGDFAPTTLPGFTAVPIPLPVDSGALQYAFGWTIQTDAMAIPTQDWNTTGTPASGYQYPITVALKSVAS